MPSGALKRPFETCEALLRVTPETLQGLSPARLVAIFVTFGCLYGATMGAFGGDDGPRGLQMLYSAIKVPLLVGVTFALSVPSFFVLMTLFGLRDDIRASLQALLATQASLSIVLASFAPFTLFWYVSSTGYSSALLFNAAMFGLASLTVQRVLKRLYQPLIARDPRHLTMMRVWLGIFGFVGIQMGWVLRPFIGNPAEPTLFLRAEAWGNAYEMLGRHIMNLLGG